MENDVFKKYLGIEFSGSDDPRYFARIFQIATAEYKIPSEQLEDEFKVTQSTIYRWQTAQSFPSETVRKVIIDRLAILCLQKEQGL